jgi:hypothetical protein
MPMASYRLGQRTRISWLVITDTLVTVSKSSIVRGFLISTSITCQCRYTIPVGQ